MKNRASNDNRKATTRNNESKGASKSLEDVICTNLNDVTKSDQKLSWPGNWETPCNGNLN